MRRAVLLAALLLVGCGQSKDEGISGGGKVIGGTVTVYSLTTDPGATSRSFVDGEKLALSDAGGKAGEFAINFTSLDLGADEDAQAQSSRRAINDPQIIAAIADATRVTVPLFNAAGILQIAPSGDPKLITNPNALPSGKDNVGLVRGTLPAEFAERYQAQFGRAPDQSAENGYRAMASVLDAIRLAGAAGNDRTRVIDSYL
ncbi:hypothetical protein DVA67_024935 [Solirubrobacter sp. CPCC 204708]|uniref:Uncharacterized protein n=1 Tax=Solirubrobacter deserti TaxID=2282478 RepID=A0ABT4RP10_9ACTN|nr:hypothetical protein [Solirubrobacter deserti]MBE2319246.1 hypothetical protein [Solirubrobacter deserti]MDA0140252.1 hypothetical protein [Solirubrobacter deserti]